jgi:alanine racemase
MIDVSGTEVKAGDEVIVFGDGLPIHEVAASIKTIPYEILTNTSERVKRVFFAESI